MNRCETWGEVEGNGVLDIQYQVRKRETNPRERKTSRITREVVRRDPD